MIDDTTPTLVNVRYFLRLPDREPGKGKRCSFGITKRWTSPNGRSTNEAYYCSELDAINSQFKKSVTDFSVAEKNARALVTRLNREVGAVCPADAFNSDNEKIFQDYWEKEYAHRDLVDPRGAYNSIMRAVRALGNVSLLSAARHELQKQINQELSGNNQRRAVERINKLLKHIQREIKLTKSKVVHEPVKFLTRDEFELVLTHIQHKGLKLLAQVAFYTGMRQGEAMAGKANDFQMDSEIPQVYVHRQVRCPRLDLKGQLIKSTLAVPKSKKRGAYIFVEGVAAVREWLSTAEGFDLTRTHASKLLKEACIRAFPDNPEKWMAFNGLRHSYAKSLFENGVNMGYVAKCLGNTEKVCQEYYSGWEHTPNSMKLLHTLVQENQLKLKMGNSAS
ncbi:MAG: tyrosine-type recombinase/integrase [Bdellovibrionales bacterium]